MYLQDTIPGFAVETRRPTPAAKFLLGEIRVSPAVRLVTPPAGPGSVEDLLARHEAADFGMLNRDHAAESWAAAQLGWVVTSAYLIYFPDLEGIWGYYHDLELAGLASDDAAIIEARTDISRGETSVGLVVDPESYYWTRCSREGREPLRRVVFVD